MKNSEKRSIAKECFRAGKQREIRFFAGLLAIWAILSVFLLMHGDESYSLQTVLRVLLGEDIRGAAYAVRTIRVPRVLVGTLAGFAFGIAGNTFQKIMRNSLASPDVMGVTTGASAAAIVSMMVWNLDGLQTELLAMAGGICAASVILLPAARRRDAVNKMILTGIGIQAMLQAVINFVILKTSDYDVSAALRWLSGSLNGARMKDVPLLGGIVLLCTAVILALSGSSSFWGWARSCLCFWECVRSAPGCC